MRLPKQVLIIPYRIINQKIEYCILKRKNMQIWQWVAGGVEDFDKDIITAAKREMKEEIGISEDIDIVELECFTKIPVVNIVKEFKWGDNVYYEYEYSFAANISDKQIKISEEHSEYKWVSYDEARNLLKYDSNKSALWELNEKIRRNNNEFN